MAADGRGVWPWTFTAFTGRAGGPDDGRPLNGSPDCGRSQSWPFMNSIVRWRAMVNLPARIASWFQTRCNSAVEYRIPRLT